MIYNPYKKLFPVKVFFLKRVDNISPTTPEPYIPSTSPLWLNHATLINIWTEGIHGRWRTWRILTMSFIIRMMEAVVGLFR